MQNIKSHENQNGFRPVSKLNLLSSSKKLATDKEKIKATWEKKVRENVLVAGEQTSLALQNTLQIFLDELSDSLAQAAATSSYDVGKKGMSQRHGGARAKFAGYFLPQLLKEFSILREVLLEDLNNADLLDYNVSSIINRSIDISISLAATEFATVQQASVQSALQKAEASNIDLEHFASVAAHDLKSPLATISGYLELLADEAQDKASKEFLDSIVVMRNAADRMRNLIDRLLEYASLGKSDRPFELVDLNVVMQSVLQNLHDTTAKTKASITFVKLPTVKGDANLLTQVFQNLIANSIKFRSEQLPKVQINAVAEHDHFLFSVEDNGIGFDPKDKDGIFALYKKLHGESSYQGAGIGLATCRKVVELHNGQIWADSEPGLGSTFYFTLPIPAQNKTTTHH
ncbi:MAG: sensor histidine kinase [Pseudobdellovibrio sp.]